jgi:hypothetical protein
MKITLELEDEVTEIINSFVDRDLEISEIVEHYLERNGN